MLRHVADTLCGPYERQRSRRHDQEKYVSYE
jgi:hypothetical protein